MADTHAAPISPEGFAARLRELRKQKGLFQMELGGCVGVHYTRMGRYEPGVSRPAADTLERLADELGVSGDDLLGGAVEEVTRARVEDHLRQLQGIEKLPEEDKAIVKRLPDAFLTRKQLQEPDAR